MELVGKNMITKFIRKKREQWSIERFDFFLNEMDLSPGIKILDLGGYDGLYMDRFKDKNRDFKIVIADIDESALQRASQKGYITVKMDGNKVFPFKDKEFDCTFCNSVIEHVTVPKEIMWNMNDDFIFKKESLQSQLFFAKEIMRCSKKYFVQSPHKLFPIESHTWFPFFALLSRPFQIKLIKMLNKVWIKATNPDWNLLTKKDMQNLFTDARIVVIKKFGFPKEVIAIKK